MPGVQGVSSTVGMYLRSHAEGFPILDRHLYYFSELMFYVMFEIVGIDGASTKAIVFSHQVKMQAMVNLHFSFSTSSPLLLLRPLSIYRSLFASPKASQRSTIAWFSLLGTAIETIF